MSKMKTMDQSSIQPLKLGYRTIYFEFETASISPPENKVQKFWLRTENGSEELVELKREDIVQFRVTYKNGWVDKPISLKQKDFQLTSGQDVVMLRIGKETRLANVSFLKKVSPTWGEQRRKKTFTDFVLIDPYTEKHYYIRDVKDFTGGWIWGEDIGAWPTIIGLPVAVIFVSLAILSAGLIYGVMALVWQPWYSYTGNKIIATIAAFLTPIISIIILSLLFRLFYLYLDWLYLKPLKENHAFEIQKHVSMLVKELLSSKSTD